MEQKTPAHGTFINMKPRVAEPVSPPPAEPVDAEKIEIVREIAANVAAIIPGSFDRVLPRGYTVNGTALIMARFEMIGTHGHALYGRHAHWGEKEANVFLRDIREGWLMELAAFMRWQLRTDPVTNAIFQHALVHLDHNAKTRLNLA